MSDADAPPTKKPSVFEQKLWTTCEVLIGQKAGEDENVCCPDILHFTEYIPSVDFGDKVHVVNPILTDNE
jgi:hypothetical protein